MDHERRESKKSVWKRASSVGKVGDESEKQVESTNVADSASVASSENIADKNAGGSVASSRETRKNPWVVAKSKATTSARVKVGPEVKPGGHASPSKRRENPKSVWKRSRKTVPSSPRRRVEARRQQIFNDDHIAESLIKSRPATPEDKGSQSKNTASAEKLVIQSTSDQPHAKPAIPSPVFSKQSSPASRVPHKNTENIKGGNFLLPQNERGKSRRRSSVYVGTDMDGLPRKYQAKVVPGSASHDQYYSAASEEESQQSVAEASMGSERFDS